MRTVGSILALAALAACAPRGQDGGGGTACRVTPPPVGLDPIADPAGALAYARALTFQAAARPFGETRRLTAVDTAAMRQLGRDTPLFSLDARVGVHPETCAYQNDLADLQGRSGRIVAQFQADAPYGKLGLPAGTSYLWIDRIVVTEGAGRGRAVLIPADGSPPQTRRVRFEQHQDAGATRGWSEARLLFTEQDDEVWASCVKFGCCYLEEGGPQDTVPASPN